MHAVVAVIVNRLPFLLSVSAYVVVIDVIAIASGVSVCVVVHSLAVVSISYWLLLLTTDGMPRFFIFLNIFSV